MLAFLGYVAPAMPNLPLTSNFMHVLHTKPAVVLPFLIFRDDTHSQGTFKRYSKCTRYHFAARFNVRWSLQMTANVRYKCR